MNKYRITKKHEGRTYFQVIYASSITALIWNFANRSHAQLDNIIEIKDIGYATDIPGTAEVIQ